MERVLPRLQCEERGTYLLCGEAGRGCLRLIRFRRVHFANSRLKVIAARARCRRICDKFFGDCLPEATSGR